MPSTEFLLYLVSVTLIVILVMNYMSQDNNNDDDKTRYVIEMLRRQERRDRHDRDRRDRENDDDDVSRGSQGSQGSMYSGQSGGQQGPCTNPQCRQAGRCVCGRNVNVHVNNLNGGPGGPIGIGGPGGPGPGGPIGPGGPGPIGPGGPGGPGGPPPDPLRKFDYDAVHDEFTPPFRRSYYDDYALHPALYPTYTRGPPGRFRKVGTLVAQGVAHGDKYKFLNLNGREKYPGREYEYFVTSVDTESKIKFYIDTRGKEIRDGDTVKVKNLEGYTYIFSEDEDLSPKYDPYFIY
jgi:hypothetical protein